MPETFQLIGQVGSDYELRVARLYHDFGDGYATTELVGNAAGEEFVTLVFNALTDRTGDQITDPEDSTAKTKFEYLKDFFLARMADGEAFNVTTTRGETLLVLFAEPGLSLRNISRKAFSTGIRFRQYRALT